MRITIKFILLFVSFTCIIILFPKNIMGKTIGEVTGDTINIRSTNNTSASNVITTVNRGYKLTLLSTNKYVDLGTACPEGLYKINYDNNPAYVCSNYVNNIANVPSYTTIDWTARIDEKFVCARSGPSKNNSCLTTLILGTNVTILDTIPTPNDVCPDKAFYKIRYHNNKEGYVCKTYVVKKEDIIKSDSEYEAVLQTKGFPSSYWPYLTHLKQKFPNWDFNAINTGVPSESPLNWDFVMNGQEWDNLIQSTIDAYRRSSVPAEGTSWFNASMGVIAFYIDPRNFLNEKNIFIFEKLGNSENITRDMVESILSGTFMSGTYVENDETKSYVDTFMLAAATAGVNPLHLASRVIQEVSPSGSAATTGTTPGYEGIYNFYSIGAPDSVYEGLAWAKTPGSYNRPWNSISKSIIEGAKIIANGYILAGQDTLYFQKFDVKTKAYFSHQYMENVQAPVHEAEEVYYTYKNSNTLSNTIIFDIPIYSNMPASTSLPFVGSVNNYLSNINIGNKNVIGFDKGISSYTHYIAKNTNTVELDATAEVEGSLVYGLGTILVPENTTNLKINVIAESGDENEYNIEIIKVDEVNTIDEIFQNLSANINNDYLSNIRINTIAANLINNIYSKSPNSQVNITTSGGIPINLNSKLATGQMLSITTPTSESRNVQIAVTGDVNGDGAITLLDLLKVQKHLVGSNIMSDSYKKAADTNNDNNVTILDLLRVQKHLLGEINL